MSHHILKDPLDRDPKLLEDDNPHSTKASDTPAHSASTSNSTLRTKTSPVSDQSPQTRPVQSYDLPPRHSQPSAEPEADAASTLQLRPKSLVADQDRRATVESDEEEDSYTKRNHGFQSPKTEDEDCYSTIVASPTSKHARSEPSSAPILRSAPPQLQTSPAPEGCSCGSDWHSTPSSVEASTPRFVSEHTSLRDVFPIHSLPAEPQNPAETYVPLGSRSAASSTNNSGLWNGATPSTLPQIPPPSANSPHDEMSTAHSSENHTPPDEEDAKDGESYTGLPGSSGDWPYYNTPVEGEDVDVINCYGPVDPVSGDATGFEHSTPLTRAQSCGWFEGKLDGQKDHSSSSIHDNVKNVNDVQRCRAAKQDQNKEVAPTIPSNSKLRKAQPSKNAFSGNHATKQSSGSALQYLKDRWKEVINEIQKTELKQTHHDEFTSRIGPRVDVRTGMGHVQLAKSLLNMMRLSGFQGSELWHDQWDHLIGLGQRGHSLRLLRFMCTEFSEFFNHSDAELESRLQRNPSAPPTPEENIKHQHRSSRAGSKTSASAPGTQAGRDLARVARQGSIDGCEAGMRLMAIVGSRPSPAWQQQYAALVEDAHELGELEPLVEFVRKEAEDVCARNASARAAGPRAADADGLAHLTETGWGSDTDFSISDDEEDINAAKLYQAQSSRAYGIWLCHNVPRFASDRITWIANACIPNNRLHILPPTDHKHFITKPFLLTLGQLFDGHETTVRMCMMVLAVKITLPEKPSAETVYAEVAIQDTGYRERLSNPARVQGFGVRGEIIDLDLEGIISQLGSVRREYARRKGKVPMGSDAQQATGSKNQASSSASGITLRRHAGDTSRSKVGSADIHLTTSETRTLHPSIFADKGVTLVPQAEFPVIPADPNNSVHYQLQVGQPPSTIFVNCERCHKILASFDNVVEGPTVARRSENESGDAYIVTAFGSLNNITDSVDRGKRVWVHVGTEKYFMCANESDVARTHDCASVEESITAEMIEDQARYSRGANGYHRPGVLPPHNHPMRQPRASPAEPAQQPKHPSIRMPSSMQFIPMQSNFPTAELTGNPPCTVIAVDELSNFIHGVCQGVVGYRAIFQGENEVGETVRLNIRDPLGAFVGTLTRIRYFELTVMDGQVYSFTSQDQAADASKVHRLAVPITAEMNAHPPSLVTAICERTSTIHGVYQGVTGYWCIFRPAGEAGDTVSLDIRDPFGAFLGKLTRVRRYEVAIMDGEIAGFTARDEVVEAAAPQNHEAAQSHGTRLRGGASSSDGWITPDKGVLEDNSDPDTDLELELPDCHGEGSAGGERALRRTAAGQWVPTRLRSQAPEHQQPSATASSSTSEPQEGDTTNPMLHAIGPASIDPASQQANTNSVGTDRIPSFLQPTSSIGPATDHGKPVFSQEYKEWLRDMYTKPANQRCTVIDTAPAPSFQDFWKDREAGRPATAANGDVFEPEPEEVSYYADIEGESIPLHIDSRDEGRAEVRQRAHEAGHAGDVPIVLFDGQPQSEGRRLAFTEKDAAQVHARLRTALPTTPKPAVLRILERFLDEQAVTKAREAFEVAVRRQ